MTNNSLFMNYYLLISYNHCTISNHLLLLQHNLPSSNLTSNQGGGAMSNKLINPYILNQYPVEL